MSEQSVKAFVGQERALVWTNSSHGSGSGSMAGSGNPQSDSERHD